MAEARVTESVAAPAAAMWARIGDFGGIQAGGPVIACTVEGSGVGAIRTLVMTSGTFLERLERYDAQRMTFTYSILNEDCPLPVRNYWTTVVVSPDPDGKACVVDWAATFEPRGVPEANVVETIKSIYRASIARHRQALVGFA